MMGGGRDRYLEAKQLAESGIDPVVCIVAAILSGSDEAAPLQRAYPVLWEETMLRRWQSEDGALPGDAQTQPQHSEFIGQ
jgi:hypothetical protein